jgi:hypothetical protein
MRRHITRHLRMARSNRSGLILCTGRPAYMPRDIYSAAQHLFILNTNDTNDIDSIGGMNGVNDKLAKALVMDLDRDAREILYVNTRTGYLCRTTASRGL